MERAGLAVEQARDSEQGPCQPALGGGGDRSWPRAEGDPATMDLKNQPAGRQQGSAATDSPGDQRPPDVHPHPPHPGGPGFPGGGGEENLLK